MAETRQYVRHAVTGESVPVLTPEEQTARQADIEQHARVFVSGFRCPCGSESEFAGIWLAIRDELTVTCTRGHVTPLRFEPKR